MRVNLIYHLVGVDKQEKTYGVDDVEPMTKFRFNEGSLCQTLAKRHTHPSLERKPVISIRTQAVRMHKNFVHFKYGLRVNNKNILGEFSSFFKRMA